MLTDDQIKKIKDRSVHHSHAVFEIAPHGERIPIHGYDDIEALLTHITTLKARLTAVEKERDEAIAAKERVEAKLGKLLRMIPREANKQISYELGRSILDEVERLAREV